MIVESRRDLDRRVPEWALLWGQSRRPSAAGYTACLSLAAWRELATLGQQERLGPPAPEPPAQSVWWRERENLALRRVESRGEPRYL